jgi:glutaredoxin/glutathione-dependent peroxiredoxin
MTKKARDSLCKAAVVVFFDNQSINPMNTAMLTLSKTAGRSYSASSKIAVAKKLKLTERMTTQMTLKRAMGSIAVGTDMISSVISLQKARPWRQCAEEGSNKAADNKVPLVDLFSGKTVAFFAVPAPFTGTCTHQHYPGYKQAAGELKRMGCDEIVCYSVSDPYALAGWSTALGNNDDHIRFLADTDGSFAKAYGVDRVYDDCSLGLRSERFSMIVVDGIVSTFRIVENAATDAEEMLNELKDIKESVAAYV